MDLITLDFETYYDKAFSLSKMTTEAYIRDPRFEVIGVAVRVNDGDTVWFSGDKEQTRQWLHKFDFENSALLCQNTMFDAGILSFIFDIHPKVLLDTMCMARAWLGVDVSVSLKSLAQHYGVGEKGTEVLQALGKHRKDFSVEELSSYAQYCVNDVELTYDIFNKMMAQGFPKRELKLIDVTLRMFTRPLLHLDMELLATHLENVKRVKAEHIKQVGAMLVSATGNTYAQEDLTDEAIQKLLQSNPKFAQVLESLGVDAPMKVSPSTGKLTYAFAKTDEAFKEMLEHEDIRVQAVVSARLGVKTTLEETRTERFMDMALRGRVPLPLKYSGARTHRWSGMDAINMQNIPSRGDTTLKQSFRAPDGYVIVGADLSNIELRMGLWLAGQTDKLKALGEGKDLYKDFASSVFGTPYDEVTKEQRFIGKTCIAEGTLVLSESGWKPIEKVSIYDRLWDGEEWACHQGLITNGLKETLQIHGAWLTPDHLVWSGSSWLEAISLTRDENILRQSLGSAAVNLPLQATYKAQEGASAPLSLLAIAHQMSIELTRIILRTSSPHVAYDVREQQEPLNVIGRMLGLCQMTSTGADYSIGWLRQLIDVITQRTRDITTTALEEYAFVTSGSQASPHFLSMCRLLMGGTCQNTKWIGSTTTTGIAPETSGLYHDRRTPITEGICTPSRRKLLVYDIASVGTRNRFTILTDAGPLIVHNCQLALIYGTGSARLRAAIKTGSGVDIGEAESKRIVSLYRTEYAQVKAAWEQGEDALRNLSAGAHTEYGMNGLIKIHGSKGCLLPSGLYMKYPDLKRVSENGKTNWTYQTRKGKEYLYGAKFFQGIVQSAARCIMGECMIRIDKRYPTLLTVHDADYVLAPETEAQEAVEFVLTEMRKAPKWAPDIPLDAEAGFGKTLADC